jgi:CRP-like cAMP-binding protein
MADCTVITFSKSFVEACIRENSRVSLNYIEFLSKRVSFLNKKINAYTAKSAENKLYTYLLQLPRTENEIILPVDMSTVAKMLGIGRATLYRAFDKLEQNGTIIKKDKKIFLNEV